MLSRHARTIALACFSSLLAAAPLEARGDDTSAPPRQVDVRYRAGLGFLERGEHALALEELDSFLKAQPNSPDAIAARYTRAICLVALKRPDEAMRDLDAAIAVRDFAYLGDALLMRARIAFDRADYTNAASLASRIERDAPAFAHVAAARLLAGESLLRAGKPKESLDFLDQAIASSGTNALDPTSRRRAALFAGHAAAALGRDRDAIERLGKATREEASGEESAAIDLLWAQCLHRLGDLPAAFGRYASAAKSSPSDAALLGAGVTGRTLGPAHPGYREATAALDQLLAGANTSDPTRAQAAVERARIWIDAGDPSAARRLLDAIDTQAFVGKNDELGARVLSWQATAAGAAGAHDEAAATLATALERFPKTSLTDAMRFDRAGALLAARAWQPAFDAYSLFLRSAPTHPLAAQAELRAAIALARLGKGADAATGFARALERLPADATSERELALAESLEIATAASNWAEMERLAGALVKASSDPARRAESLLRFGIAAARQKRPEEAARAFDQLLGESAKGVERNELRVHARLERSEAFLALGRESDAVTDLRAVLDVSSGATPAQRAAGTTRLTNLLLRSGKAKEAQELLASAAAMGIEDQGMAVELAVDLAISQSLNGDNAAAVATLDRFLQAHPEGPRVTEARARRGIAHAREGAAENALRDFDAVLDRSAIPPLGAELRPLIEFERASALLALGRPKDAEKALLAVSKGESPYRAFALVERARLALDGDGASAATEARQLLGDAERSLETVRAADRPALEERLLYLAGIAATRAGTYEDARVAFASLQERFPKGPLAAASRPAAGEALLALDRAGEAAVQFKAAIAANPSAESLPTLQLRLGEACARSSDWNGSDAAYAAYLGGQPNGPFAHQARFGRAWASEQLARHAEAIERYRELVSQHDGPTAARAQFQIGECLFALGKLDEAVKEFMKVDVLFAYPEWSAAALYEAGRCLATLGRTDQARTLFTTVREKYASTRWAELAARETDRLKPDALPGRQSSGSATNSGL